MNEEIRVQLAEVQKNLLHASAHIEWMETSKFWKLRKLWCKLRSKLKHAYRRSTRITDPEFLSVLRSPFLSDYSIWQHHNTPRSTDLQRMTETVEVFPSKPLISILLPVYNPPQKFLEEAIESVINQVYPYWELCIADDASTLLYVKKTLEHYRSHDPRIKVVYREENGHISNCSNSALKIACGEYVSLLDHDDVMTSDALYEIVLLINRRPEADMIYSDEDKINSQGMLDAPYFKPNWCPDFFLSQMYTCHLSTYRRSILDEIGGFRVGYEGSQDYDLVLRFTEKTTNIFHIPKILYHWRIHPESAASGSAAKPYAYIAAEKAIADALQRRGEPGIVSGVPKLLGHYVIRYEVSAADLVTIIIPTRDLAVVLDKCLNSIFHLTNYQNYEVIVVDNGSVESETFEVFSRWEKLEPSRFRVVQNHIPFNYSKLNNAAAAMSKGKYLLFLNNDTEVIHSDWLYAMVEQAQRSSIGAVGVKLLYSNHSIQHAGIILGANGFIGHSHKGFHRDDPGYFGRVGVTSNYSAVTGACLMCRREIFESVGGFEENLAIAYNDVDLCFKFLDKGYRNIYLAHVELYHHESISRGSDKTYEKHKRLTKERDYLEEKWSELLKHDACYSPNLAQNREDFSIKSIELSAISKGYTSKPSYD